MDLMMQTSVKGALFTKAKRLTNNFAAIAALTLMEMGEERLSKTLRPQGNKQLSAENMKGVFKTAREAGKRNASTGHYRRSISGQMFGQIARITDSGVIYGPWLEGVGSRNGAGFRGYFQFRLTGEYIKKNTDKVKDELLPKYIRKMNGV